MGAGFEEPTGARPIDSDKTIVGASTGVVKLSSVELTAVRGIEEADRDGIDGRDR